MERAKHALPFDLKHVSLGDGVAGSLKEALPLLDPKRVDLADCRLGDRGLKVISEALASSTRLEALRLSENHMGLKASKALAEAFRGGLRVTLRELKLRDCGLSGPQLKIVVDGLVGDETPGALQTLDLSHNAIDLGAAKSLRHLLEGRAAPYISDVAFRWTHLRGEAAYDVCKGLEASRVLTADLAWNAWCRVEPEDDRAVVGLADLLRNTGNLTHLDVSHSRMDAGGGAAMERAFRVIPPILPRPPRRFPRRRARWRPSPTPSRRTTPWLVCT